MSGLSYYIIIAYHIRPSTLFTSQKKKQILTIEEKVHFLYLASYLKKRLLTTHPCERTIHLQWTMND